MKICFSHATKPYYQLKELYEYLKIHSHTLTLPYCAPPARVVGKDGFEPPNSEENRFTVCCRWPLDYLPGFTFPRLTRMSHFGKQLFCQLSQRRESNPRPADYKSAALPSELLWHDFFNNMGLTVLQRTKTDGFIRPFFWEGKGKRIC
jgi:hypothetical protein